MCISKNEILELNDIIQHINSINTEHEREIYLKEVVEDVDLFIATLKGINKSKLVKRKQKKETFERVNKYSKEVVIQLFRDKGMDDIVSEYSKQELTEMYLTFYSKKPLTSFDKKEIASNIYRYIYTMDRTKALLG